MNEKDDDEINTADETKKIDSRGVSDKNAKNHTNILKDFIQANYTKFNIFIKACNVVLCSFIFPLIFLSKDWGVVDLIRDSSINKYRGKYK